MQRRSPTPPTPPAQSPPLIEVFDVTLEASAVSSSVSNLSLASVPSPPPASVSPPPAPIHAWEESPDAMREIIFEIENAQNTLQKIDGAKCVDLLKKLGDNKISYAHIPHACELILDLED